MSAERPLDPSRIASQSAPSEGHASEAASQIGLMVGHAQRLGMVGPLHALVAEWYRANVDAEAFKAGHTLGPPA